MNRIRREGQLFDSETFQGYLKGMHFELPAEFPEAKSVIIMATFIKPMMVNFHFEDACIPVAMLPNYYDSGLTGEIPRNEIQKNIIAQDGYWAENTGNYFNLKLLAARSGLGRYGRNNICYVDGMGSFVTLHAFLTDFLFEIDHWGEMQMMGYCKNCRTCIKQCPGGAIREDRFLIDVKRCIPFYNEVEGELPDRIPARAHNSFMGWLEDITEEETRQFIDGDPDQSVIFSVSQKLKIPSLVEYREMVEVASRNIKSLLQGRM